LASSTNLGADSAALARRLTSFSVQVTTDGFPTFEIALNYESADCSGQPLISPTPSWAFAGTLMVNGSLGPMGTAYLPTGTVSQHPVGS